MKPDTVRTGRRYRSHRLNPPYDAIVIGSGIGGLSAAVCLSRAGKKVLVLEQHYTAGGFSHAYCRNGYEWDVGVHYVGGVGYSKSMEAKLFAFLTGNQLQWSPMSDNYDRLYFGDKQFDLVKGKEAFKEQLLNYFPEEQNAIEEYMTMVRKTVKGVPWFSTGKIMPQWLFKLLNQVGIIRFPSFFNEPTIDVLKRLTSNKELIAVMTGQWGDYGLPPEYSSFLIHSLIVDHYMYGGYYPVGGASRIADTMIPQIEAAGGEVLTYAEVSQIIVENGRASGVEMKDGTRIGARNIISNAGVLNTFNRLLPGCEVNRAGYIDQLKQVTPALSHLCLYIGIKRDAEALELPKTNFWVYPDAEHTNNINRFLSDRDSPFPCVYISFPSVKDPDWKRRYPNRSTIEIVAPASYEWFKPWQGTTWGKRGEDYDQLKEQFSQRLLEILYQKLPQLRGKIDYYELSTPLSTHHFCAYPRGEIYGLNHDPKRFNQQWLRPKTRIPGLYLTGQDTLTVGVVGAAMSGLMTACSVLGGLKGWKLLGQVRGV